MERTYRKRIAVKDLVSFHVAVKETDLWISADEALERETRDRVLAYRFQLERYILKHPNFLTALGPFPEDPLAPEMIREMIGITREIGVGPMASVAGALAQYVGTDLLQWTDRVIVENGGDIFLKVDRPVTIKIFAGGSVFSERLGLMIRESQMPLGVCSSSGTVGHSMSTGAADCVCILSPSTIRADGAATAIGNKIRRPEDLEGLQAREGSMKDILGGVVVLGDRMAAWGDIKLVHL